MHCHSKRIHKGAGCVVLGVCAAALLFAVPQVFADQSGYPPPPGPYLSEPAEITPTTDRANSAGTQADMGAAPTLPAGGIPAPLELATEPTRATALFGAQTQTSEDAPPRDRPWRRNDTTGSRSEPVRAPATFSWRDAGSAVAPSANELPRSVEPDGSYAYRDSDYGVRSQPPAYSPGYAGYQGYYAPGGWTTPGYTAPAYGYQSGYQPYGYGYYGRAMMPQPTSGGAPSEAIGPESEQPVWRASNRPASRAQATQQEAVSEVSDPSGSVFRPRNEQPTW